MATWVLAVAAHGQRKSPSRRAEDGRWPLQNTHVGELHFALDEGEGRPSRWNSLRAMRVLRWYEDGVQTGRD